MVCTYKVFTTTFTFTLAYTNEWLLLNRAVSPTESNSRLSVLPKGTRTQLEPPTISYQLSHGRPVKL